MDYQLKISEFINKASELLDNVGVKEEKEEIVSKLTATFVANLSNLLGAKLDFNESITKASESGVNIFKYLDQNNIDYTVEFDSAKKQTLETFITSSSSLFPPEKVEELNKIISE